MLCGEGIQFPFYQPFRKTYAATELLKVFPTYTPCVRQLHSFLEQSFVKGKDVRLTQMKVGVDKVVCRSEAVFAIATANQREILQMGIIIERKVIEHHDTEELQYLNGGSCDIFADYICTLFIT